MDFHSIMTEETEEEQQATEQIGNTEEMGIMVLLVIGLAIAVY